MSNPDKKENYSSADRDKTTEDVAQLVPPEQSDDLFTDRGTTNVSSPEGDNTGSNKVATSLDNE